MWKFFTNFLVSKNLLNKVKLSFEKERYDKSHDMGQIRGKIEKLWIWFKRWGQAWNFDTKHADFKFHTFKLWLPKYLEKLV